MKDTKIQWTNNTWNPVRGCSRVSKGCTNCYAEKIAARFNGPGLAFEGMTDDKGRWNGVVRLIPDKLGEPLTWRDPKMVFVNSMSDLFHESLTNEQIAAVFGVMAAAPRHTFQVLTKRPKRVLEWFGWMASETKRQRDPKGSETCIYHASIAVTGEDWKKADWLPCPLWPLSNVWLGVSVENQQTADERIPLLLQCPAAVRWVSYEPALGPVDFRDWTTESISECMSHIVPALDWIVVGGESGQGARPFDIDWAVDVLRQRDGTDCRVFVKQLGKCPYRIIEPHKRMYVGDNMSMLGIRDPKGGDISEWPKVLQVREWPAAFTGAVD